MNIFGKTKDIVGLGSDLSSLGDLFKQAAQKEDLTISPDPNPEQGSYFRSDTHVFGIFYSSICVYCVYVCIVYMYVLCICMYCIG